MVIHYILSVICGLGVIGIDQLTKFYISTNFTLDQTGDFLNGFISLCYVHNPGAAWGILSGKTWLLLVVTLAVMICCVVWIIKTGAKNKLLLWAITMVLSGGIGNLIDRVFRNGTVVDFLQFDFWKDFPVFNIADCAIVLGAGLLILYFTLDTIKEYKQSKALKEEQNGEA